MVSTATQDRTGRRTTVVNGASGIPEALRGPVMRRRMSPSRILLGAVLILGFALAGAGVAKQVDTRVPVLATAHPLAAGQIIADTDLTVVRVAAGAGVATMPASARAAVVGRAAAMPLAAGTLLAPGELGDVAWPPAGQAVMAVGVKPGHAPAGLAAGNHVRVLILPTSGGGAPGSSTANATEVLQADATVVSVHEAADQSGTSVVSLLLSSSDATRLASTAGDVSLVQLGAGR
jgi:hypothetical protein